METIAIDFLERLELCLHSYQAALINDNLSLFHYGSVNKCLELKVRIVFVLLRVAPSRDRVGVGGAFLSCNHAEEEV